MPAQNNQYFVDKIQTIQDERKRIIVLEDWRLELPVADIFDEPLRCYKVNEEWAKIITGAVDLLCEIAVWKDAQDEGYIGIRKILDFLQGADCMDCLDVEDCLETSTIIATLQATDINLQGQIDSNDTDITALQAADVVHANDIIALYTENDVQDTAISQNATDIASNLVKIQQNENDIVDILLSIQQHDLTFADHEERIIALELRAAGSIGNIQIAHAEKNTIITGDYTKTGSAWANVSSDDTNIPIALAGKGLTQVVYSFDSFVTGAAGVNYVEFQIKALPTSNLSATYRLWSTGNGYAEITTLTAQFFNLPARDDYNFKLQWRVFGGTAFLGDGYCSMQIFELSGKPYIVDFDDGYPYEPASGDVGFLDDGGRDDTDCWKGTNMDQGEYIGVDIDLNNDRDIHNIVLDMRSTDIDTMNILILIDGTPLLSHPVVGPNNTWQTIDLSDIFPAFFPVNGQVVTIRQITSALLLVNTRLDNIRIVS